MATLIVQHFNISLLVVEMLKDGSARDVVVIGEITKAKPSAFPVRFRQMSTVIVTVALVKLLFTR